MDLAVSPTPFGPEERRRILRSTRKLEQVFGTSSFLIDSTGARRPLHLLPAAASRPPRQNYEHMRVHPVMSTAQTAEPAAPVPRPRRAGHPNRRQGSIFELSEEQILALGRPDLPQPCDLAKSLTNDLPRPSIESDISSTSAATSSEMSSLLGRSDNWSASSSRTSIDVEMDLRPHSPVEVVSVSLGKVRAPKRKRGDNYLTVKTPSPVDSATQGLPMPRTAPLDRTPSSPLTPTTPAESERRHRCLSKVKRTLGENIPIELIFPSPQLKRARRMSLAGLTDKQCPMREPSLDESLRPFGWVADEYAKVPTSEHLVSSREATRHRSMSTTRRLPGPFQTKGAEDLPILIMPLQEVVNSVESSRPIFASGPRQPETECWVGSWNRPDIYMVQHELRLLRAR
ncbi:hypothetical protein K488DRAFT_88564 [Vararia minispora EC-137]|uniref:Uncharacterized protein n=1 Tax=Vararia minispora EC-137 TaxID=1314806 RepID=A0ACB8QDD1_9AGAM|nr:hypothetical protein K488DRAFT_88564 [Vararia minispora EC-137]